jgi:hypothetical protein
VSTEYSIRVHPKKFIQTIINGFLTQQNEVGRHVGREKSEKRDDHLSSSKEDAEKCHINKSLCLPFRLEMKKDF